MAASSWARCCQTGRRLCAGPSAIFRGCDRGRPKAWWGSGRTPALCDRFFMCSIVFNFGIPLCTFLCCLALVLGIQQERNKRFFAKRAVREAIGNPYTTSIRLRWDDIHEKDAVVAARRACCLSPVFRNFRPPFSILWIVGLILRASDVL